MKITIIGSSTTWTDRPMSSYCIDNKILVDCGEGTQKSYTKCGVNISDIKHIFLTHTHSDHTAAITTFLSEHIDYCTPEKKKTLTIYGGKGITRFLTDTYKLFLYPKEINIEEYINIVEITDFNQKIIIDNYEVSVTKLVHGSLEDIAYTFNNGKKKIGFSGDCTYDENLENFINNIDIGFVECCGKETTKYHLGYDKFKYFQDKYKNKVFFAIHCNDNIFLSSKELNILTPDSGDKFEF